MKYLIALIIFIFNLFNYQHPVNSIIYLAIHIFLFSLFIIVERKKSNVFILLESMIVSWPISWINIFGGSTETLQLPWYYIFGLFIAILMLFYRTKKTVLYGKKYIIMTYLFLLMYTIIPLILSHNFFDGIGDYIMLMFYIVIMFLTYISNYKLSENDIEELKTMFIFINLISSIGIIYQYCMFKYMHVALFKLGRSGSFSGNQISCSLLFEDTSCSTIMIGCGALYSLIRAMKGNNKKYYIIMFVIVLGLALTSRRTSVISLIIVLVLYFFLSKQSNLKKIVSIIALPAIILGVLYFLSLSRPVSDYSQYIDDTGRFADYISGIEVALKNPLGIGYGDTYLSSLMEGNHIIPHNTILRWLDIGGIFLALPLIIILISILNISKEKKMYSDYWVLIYVFLASNFIPDILNSRFLILICLFVLLDKHEEMKKSNE